MPAGDGELPGRPSGQGGPLVVFVLYVQLQEQKYRMSFAWLKLATAHC